MNKFLGSAIVVCILLIVVEVFKVYYIMPFPGSQEDETIRIAYAFHQYIWLMRIVGWVLLGYLLFKGWRVKPWARIVMAIPLLMYGMVVYAFNFKFMADKMFYQPETKVLLPLDENVIDTKDIVLGVTINGEAKAYPLEIIGYHHQVADTLGGEPIMVTYCTVCRTGRVYKPMVNGEYEKFRLVGMDHFNAMFEDETTGSWWRQATGEAIAGELEGQKLEEIYSEQTTLESWANKHPNTLVLQPDSNFVEKYEDLAGFGRAVLKEKENKLEGRDTTSWGRKSLVVGVSIGGVSRAYDWNRLQQERIINDSFNNTPIVLVLEPDGHTFHVFERSVDDEVIKLVLSTDGKSMFDASRPIVWNFSGLCTDGEMEDEQLKPIQAYQEFWHSWQTFHPNTTKY